MEIQLSWIQYINIGLIVIFLWSVIRLTTKGLLLGLVQLLRVFIALIAAMLLAGPLAEVFPLINYRSGMIEGMIASLLSVQGSQPIWFVIVFIVVFIITKLVEPFIKILDEVPIASTLNRAGGFLLGIIIGWIKLFVIMWIVTTPLFTNGQEIVEQSYLKYVRDSVSYLDFISEPLANNHILQKLSAGEPLSELEKSVIENMLADKGLGHDQIVDFLESIKNE